VVLLVPGLSPLRPDTGKGHHVMFVLKKVITPFLLPPGFFVIVLVILGIWAVRRKNRYGAGASFFVAALVWVFALAPVSDVFRKGLESDLSLEVDQAADVIIMLGGGVRSGVPDLTGIGAPSSDTMTRLVAAARLHRRLGIPILVSGGRVFKDGEPVARIAKRFLIDLGLPPDMVISEERSRDTYENAVYCKRICDERGFTRPVMVTSGYHVKRSLFCFERAGLSVTAYPSDLTLEPEKSYYWHSFLPSSGALRATAASLHEWLGMIAYRLAY
jgi:uncharacterized SAM-binding protein YcdF (DUF218 family)